MTDNRLTPEELNSFSEWLPKFLEEAAHHQETINRQKAEIERLQNTIIALVNYLDILGVDKTDTSLVKEAYELNAQIRAAVKDEAFKELAERLKAKALSTIRGGQLGVIDCYDIEKVVTEMRVIQNESKSHG